VPPADVKLKVRPTRTPVQEHWSVGPLGGKPFSLDAAPLATLSKRFRLVARVSTDSPASVRPVLRKLIVSGTVKVGEAVGEFVVEAEMVGSSARDLNRSLLSALRAVEKRTRLRAEWTSDGVTEKFFDYVAKSRRSGPTSTSTSET
jgi:hypothetical protein